MGFLHAALFASLSLASVQQPGQGPRELVLQHSRSIRTDSAGHFFRAVTQVSVGPRGEVVVVDQGKSAAWEFDSLGRFVRTFISGSRVLAAWYRDSIDFVDPTQGTVSTFASSGGGVRGLPLRQFTTSGLQMTFSLLRRVDPGRLVATPLIASGLSGQEPGVLRYPLLAVEHADSRILANVTVWPGELLIIPQPTGGTLVVRRSPAGRLSAVGMQWTVGVDGSVVLAERLTNDSAFLVTRIGFGGDTVFKRRFSYSPILVSPLLADSLVREQARFVRGAGETVARDLVLETIGDILSYPPVSQVLIARNGFIWVAREDVRGRLRAWWVLDSDGRDLFVTTTPPGFEAMAAGTRSLWGLCRDTLGVLEVVKLSAK